jgi:hypothetical protein
MQSIDWACLPACPNSEARPGPSRPAAGPTSGKLLTRHVPPSGLVTLAHDTLAAKNPNEQIKDSMLVYLNCLCTCSAVLGGTDAMDECDKRAIGNMSFSTCILQIRYPLTKGREREEKGGGGGDLRKQPAVTYAGCANIRKRATEGYKRTWCCAWNRTKLHLRLQSPESDLLPRVNRVVFTGKGRQHQSRTRGHVTLLPERTPVPFLHRSCVPSLNAPVVGLSQRHPSFR